MECKKFSWGGVILGFILSLLTFSVSAQNRNISGNVKDATGEPMIGVNVKVVGTTNGTITDFDGNYTIQAPANSQLQFSFIGYIAQTVAVGNKSVINVVLKEDATDLEEVVVIGYGTVKKKDLTGSVASISSKDLVANPVADVTQAL